LLFPICQQDFEGYGIYDAIFISRPLLEPYILHHSKVNQEFL
jgi:hypothetical protein